MAELLTELLVGTRVKRVAMRNSYDAPGVPVGSIGVIVEGPLDRPAVLWDFMKNKFTEVRKGTEQVYLRIEAVQLARVD